MNNAHPGSSIMFLYDAFHLLNKIVSITSSAAKRAIKNGKSHKFSIIEMQNKSRFFYLLVDLNDYHALIWSIHVMDGKYKLPVLPVKLRRQK